jgi:hypothetical protein
LHHGLLELVEPVVILVCLRLANGDLETIVLGIEIYVHLSLSLLLTLIQKILLSITSIHCYAAWGFCI